MSTYPNVGVQQNTWIQQNVVHTVFLWVSMSSTLNFRLATKRFSHQKKTSNFLKQQSTPRDKCTYLKVIQANGALWTFLADTAEFSEAASPFRYLQIRFNSVSRHSPQCRSQWPGTFRKTTVTTTTNGWVGLIGSKSGKPTRMASHGSHGTFTLGRFRRVEAEAPSLGFSAQGSLKKRWKVKRLIATVHLFMI